MTRLLSFCLLAACSSQVTATPKKDAGISLSGFDGGPRPGECAQETKAIYLVSNEADLFKFAPETEDFTLVGRLLCGAPGSNPTSMAVDRKGTAWVRYDDESLVSASITNASCVRTTFRSGQVGFNKFGMGFSADPMSASGETLFLSDSNGKGLATLDTKTLTVRAIGPVKGEFFGKKAELTVLSRVSTCEDGGN
jgi:hypothetical protein